MIHTDGKQTIVNAEPRPFWHDGNSLALFKAVKEKARELDGGFSGPAHERLNSHLFGMATVVGLSREDAREAFESDEALTIYAP